ncbi:radical SAM protein [Halodesulfovibrio marinisediminis]|uniref:Radical SAM superfamily enzyme, MoaA/NifB/PqqE/SkfB family n=1 Tax=Halodesulfovibrio marinisediminis DSM 17456 TaxID=1121457 RepID=A0A1N6HC42_9BACT|nr:radical SAM protein [Halodesulfovibrio marinisediminis]SIO17411.1 Radical SAM superfamily enzyme, MoaA/NifB/PqqE/SkfB family [Halodesulfovibrio marinisediminis DSM 17456]
MLNYNKSMIWNMTRNCNFQCSYCYFPHKNEKITNPITFESLLNFLNKNDDVWLVGMTGGEPFIYPNFVSLCEQLTKKHFIGVDTNLSLSKEIKAFAEKISPSRVNDIYASLHIEEREKRNAVQNFIDNYHTLADAGFTIKVNYVLHPTMEARYPKDVAFFKDNGIPITPRPFKGIYNNLKYPQNYSSEIKNIFADHPTAGTKMVFNFRGVDCKSGQTFIRMEPDGTIFRCPGDRTVLGNIHENVNLYACATPCNVNRCPCQGINYVKLNPAEGWFIEGMRLFLTGAEKNAANAFRQTLLYDSEHSSALNNIGVFAYENKNYAHAKRLFEQAHNFHPQVPLFKQNLEIVKNTLEGDKQLSIHPEISEIVRPSVVNYEYSVTPEQSTE